MTKKERIYTVINHQETDFVPYHIACLSAAERKLKEYYGNVDLDEIIGNYIAMFEPSFYSLFQAELIS